MMTSSCARQAEGRHDPPAAVITLVMSRNCRLSYSARVESSHGQVLAGVSDSAENALPVDAGEAVTSELAVALGARTVSFLIADLSGRALVRLAHVPSSGTGGARRYRDEAAP